MDGLTEVCFGVSKELAGKFACLDTCTGFYALLGIHVRYLRNDTLWERIYPDTCTT